jgi:probable HAF family extracellular repeat protein
MTSATPRTCEVPKSLQLMNRIFTAGRLLAGLGVTIVGGLVAEPFANPTAPVLLQENTPPTVTLLEPRDGIVMRPGDSLTLAAEAWDLDGAVVEVRFYHGDELLGHRRFIPYRWEVESLELGVQQFRAEAVDNEGAVSSSAWVTVFVEFPPSNVPPHIRILHPEPGSVVIAPVDLEVRVEAWDEDGYVDRVSFYTGDFHLEDLHEQPFTFRWGPLGVGTYSIRAIAYDNRQSPRTETDPVPFHVAAPADMRIPWYQLVDLGTLGGEASAALAINNAGQVTGWAEREDRFHEAFVWDNGVMTGLGMVEGRTVATGINDHGVVVGTRHIGGGGQSEAFRWTSGEGTVVLPSLGGSQAEAHGINEHGQIAGWATTPDGPAHPVLWDGGEPVRFLGDVVGSASAINNLGQVVGTYEVVEWQTNLAFIWAPGQFTPIGTLGGDNSAAWAINDASQVVGQAHRENYRWRQAISWQDGEVSLVGGLGGDESRAYGINAAGQIVGESSTAGRDQRAFLRHEGVLFDLNTLMPRQTNWLLRTAQAINDAGMIVGTGAVHDGERWTHRAFLLAPYPDGWPRVTVQPVNRTVLLGSEARFEVEATGLDPIEYQWLRNGVALEDGSGIHGARTAQLVIESAAVAHAGDYTVQIDNEVGEAMSQVVTLRVVQLDALPGTELWVARGEGPVGGSPTIGHDGTIYMASLDQHLYAFRVPGDLLWRFATRGHIRGTAAVGRDGTVYFGADHPDEQLYAVSPEGELRWTYPGRLGNTSPAVGDDGTIYFHAPGRLHALTPEGAVRWVFETGGDAWISSPSLGADGTIYIGTSRPVEGIAHTVGFLQAVDPGGELLWEFSARGPFLSAPAIGADGTIYLASAANEGVVYALDSEGTVKWQFATGVTLQNSPAVTADGRVYVAVGYQLQALADGARLWSFLAEGQIECTPAIGSDNLIYFTSRDGRLYALRPNGFVARSFMTGFGNTGASSPVLTDEEVVYFAADWSLYAVKSSSGLARDGWPMLQADPQHSGRALVGPTPSVVLTEPGSDLIRRPGEDVLVRAHAAGGDGGIAAVTFFANDIELTTVTNRPYRFVWPDPASGDYLLTARAVDHAGQAAISPPVELTINEPPWIEWQVPVDQTEVFAGDPLELKVAAEDIDGRIVRVDFFVHEGLLGTVTETPFVFTWAEPVVGDLAMRARATDDLGGVTWTDPVRLVVRPRFFLRLRPAEGRTVLFDPEDLELTVEAIHLDGTVESVSIYRGQEQEAFWTGPPYTARWSNLPLGVHRFMARGTDDRNVQQVSAPLDIQVLNPEGRYQTEWRVADGDWFGAVHWSIRPPTPGDTAWIDNRGKARLTDGDAITDRLVVGQSNEGALEQSGGRLEIAQAFILGEVPGATGHYTLGGDGHLLAGEGVFVGLDGDGEVVQTGGHLEVARLGLSGNVHGYGVYRLEGGLLNARSQGIAAYGVGEFIQTGGTNQAAWSIEIGTHRGTEALYRLEGGLLTSPVLVIGQNGYDSATLRQSGGELRLGELRVGNFSPGVLDLIDGVVSVQDLVLGDRSGGELNIHSPAVELEVHGELIFGQNAAISAVPGSTIRFHGTRVDVITRRPQRLDGLGNLHLVIESGDEPVRFEIASWPAWGYETNFAFGALILGGEAPGWIALENERVNRMNGPGPEALLTRRLVMAENGRLDMNGHAVHVREPGDGLAGTIELGGGLLSFEHGATFEERARLKGSGTVLGAIASDGIIRADGGPLFLIGPVEQSERGRIEIALAEANPGLIHCADVADFRGGLVVDWVGDTLPEIGRTWHLIAGSRVGVRFDAMDWPAPTGGVAWQLRQATDGVWVETVHQPEMEVLGPMRLNRQTGLFEQIIEVTNVGDGPLAGVQLIVRNLPENARLHNGFSRGDGVAFVGFDFQLAPGSRTQFTLEFYLPDRQPLVDLDWVADTWFRVETVPAPGLVLEIDRQLPLADGRFLVEFMTRSDRVYRVQYSGDLLEWITAEPSVAGTGSRIQWIDSGPPKTDSHPADGATRFYRVLELDPGVPIVNH